MQYYGSINYYKCIEYWINLSQWVVMDQMLRLSSRADAKQIDWEIYYYLSSWKLVEMLPVVSEKKNTFLKIIKTLIDKELLQRIEYWNRSYYRLTQKWKSFNHSVEKNQHLEQSVEINPEECGNKSTPSVEINQDYTNNKNTNKKNTIFKESDFEDFWKKYPRKVAKPTALKKYKALIKNWTVTHERIMEWLNNYNIYIRKLWIDMQFIKHPPTWLNNGCWDDELWTKVKTEIIPTQKSVENKQIDPKADVKSGLQNVDKTLAYAMLQKARASILR